ncbi:MAG: RagB/SusD family nutrient uptake outer membrane protein [Dysgonamonadaceae bacterium]|jgi:hypothetical protein|nr:RagB/SusD family nutrient uptake outer membrane protein [Dysgonamonadaceae bacterium]
MKQTGYIAIITGILLSGCVNLDREMVTTLTKEQVNKEYEYARFQAASLYTNLPEGFFELGEAMQASACDEATFSYSGSVKTIHSGGWSPINNPDDGLGRYYTAIRKVNDFLNPAVEVNLDAYRLDPTESSQIIYRTRSAEIRNWKYEARFLRTFYFFELVKRYGGLPIITQPLPLEADFTAINRNSLSECFQFILDECDSVSVDGALPAKYGSEDLGRVTKGAALALKSRVLLYMASDLYNSPQVWAQGYAHNELISIPSGNRSQRWKAAADAALKVINLTEAGYNLLTNYTQLGKTFDNPELIMVRRRDANNYFEQINFPMGYPGGRGSVTPSQNLADAYERMDGTPFDWNNPVHSANPYSGRDPRLDFTVYRNESKFREVTLQCYTGGANGKGILKATTTGYYIRKFIDENLDLQLGRSSVHSWPLFRISEMYLNYAEALNEYDPGNPNILLYINKIRGRNGVSMPPVTVTDQNLVRERIRNERRIELAFEEHRLWDVRRWMIAHEVLNKPLYGIEITKHDTGFSYKKIEVEKRVFDPKMYFYPIPQNILLMKGNQWVQNPLW